MKIPRLASTVVPLANVVVGGVLLVVGGKLIRHGQPGACELHEHTPEELQWFITMGMAAVVPAIGSIALATWMVFNKPSVNLIYLAAIPVLIAIQILSPTLPGLTPDASFCVVSVVLFAAYWYLCPRIAQMYGLTEQIREQANIGLKLFSLFGIGFVVPYETLQRNLSPDQPMLFAVVFLSAPFLIYFSIKHWRLSGSRWKPMVLCVCAAISVLVAIDLNYQRWRPNPFAPTIVQSQFEFVENSAGRSTRVGWDRWKLSITDFANGVHKISTDIRPASARIDGKIHAEDGHVLNWRLSTSDLLSFEFVIDDTQYFLGRGSSFQIAQTNGRFLVEQIAQGNYQEQVDRFEEKIGIDKFARGNLEPEIQTRKVFSPNRSAWFRETNFFYTLSWPALQISDEFDSDHLLSLDYEQGFETFTSTFAIGGGKRQHTWQAMTDGKQIREVCVDGKTYKLEDGARFILSASDGNLHVTQSRRLTPLDWNGRPVLSLKRGF